MTLSEERLREMLIEWLTKRGQPDSGMHYQSNAAHGIARVELYGADADFVAKHFHGDGARKLADALSLRSDAHTSGEVKVGDTVRILRARNAYGADVYTFSTKSYAVGETFVVGRIDDDKTGYPCPLVFPEGEGIDFWRSDDLAALSLGHPIQGEAVAESLRGEAMNTYSWIGSAFLADTSDDDKRDLRSWLSGLPATLNQAADIIEGAALAAAKGAGE